MIRSDTMELRTWETVRRGDIVRITKRFMLLRKRIRISEKKQKRRAKILREYKQRGRRNKTKAQQKVRKYEAILLDKNLKRASKTIIMLPTSYVVEKFDNMAEAKRMVVLESI